MTARLWAIIRSIFISGVRWGARSQSDWDWLWRSRNAASWSLRATAKMLMGLGALATAAAKKPENLAIAVIDNEHYGETGMQPTHTSAGVDLAGIALTCGFRQTATVRQVSELDAAVPMLHTAKGPV